MEYRRNFSKDEISYFSGTKKRKREREREREREKERKKRNRIFPEKIYPRYVYFSFLFHLRDLLISSNVAEENERYFGDDTSRRFRERRR